MPRKILVVHDKPVMVRLIQHHLEKAGYVLIRARNAQEAAVAVTREGPELVLLGDSRPATSAGEAIHKLQSRNVIPIPIIRMTDIPAGLQKINGSEEVVFTKPFSPTRLLAEIKRLIPVVEHKMTGTDSK